LSRHVRALESASSDRCQYRLVLCRETLSLEATFALETIIIAPGNKQLTVETYVNICFKFPFYKGSLNVF
jgi:hypothetical protein